MGVFTVKRECAHVCVDLDQWGKTTYTYCPFPVVTRVGGVDYCRTHGHENTMREKIILARNPEAS